VKSFYSNGKLLLTGEYVVLDGALSLAVPTKFGQLLEIESLNEPKLIWKSFDEKGSIWFEDIFLLEKIVTSYTPRNAISDRLVEILNTAKQLNPDFLNTNKGFKVSTKLDFPKNWGLGTSSTLINNVAQWAHIDAYKLLENTFGGSGYDIACAQHNSPITYQLQKGTPVTKPISFNIAFKDHLYFVHLNKKQNSRDGIKHYNANKGSLGVVISDINDITLKMITCNSLTEFENLLNLHETIIAKVTKQTPVKALLFSDFKGSIKSLGAWGGDFILVAAEENPTGYFKEKGLETIVPYTEMVL
jgi:mevalonate kinase